MCTVGDQIKLCTCGDLIDEDKPHWHLARLNVLQPEVESVRVGLFLSSESFEKQATECWLVAELNRTNCFDFNYMPLDGDILTINIEGGAFRFYFSLDRGGWQPVQPPEDLLDRTVGAHGYVTKVQ